MAMRQFSIFYPFAILQVLSDNKERQIVIEQPRSHVLMLLLHGLRKYYIYDFCSLLDLSKNANTRLMIIDFNYDKRSTEHNR